MDRILANFSTARFVAAALAGFALVNLAFSRNDLANGIAAALLLLVTAQIVIDTYSEQRSLRYAASLHARPPA